MVFCVAGHCRRGSSRERKRFRDEGRGSWETARSRYRCGQEGIPRRRVRSAGAGGDCQGGRHCCTASHHARTGACGISIRWAKSPRTGEAPGKSLSPPAVGQGLTSANRQSGGNVDACTTIGCFSHGIPSEGPHFRLCCPEHHRIASPEAVPRPGDLCPLSSWHLAGGRAVEGCFRGNSLLAVGTNRRIANVAANQMNRQAQINLSYAETNCSQ